MKIIYLYRDVTDNLIVHAYLLAVHNAFSLQWETLGPNMHLMKWFHYVVVTSIWRDNDGIITTCVCWEFL